MVESPEEFAERLLDSSVETLLNGYRVCGILKHFDLAERLIRARDAAIRQDAIRECVEAVEHTVLRVDSMRQSRADIIRALRGLLPAPTEEPKP